MRVTSREKSNELQSKTLNLFQNNCVLFVFTFLSAVQFKYNVLMFNPAKFLFQNINLYSLLPLKW